MIGIPIRDVVSVRGPPLRTQKIHDGTSDYTYWLKELGDCRVTWTADIDGYIRKMSHEGRDCKFGLFGP